MTIKGTAALAAVGLLVANQAAAQAATPAAATSPAETDEGAPPKPIAGVAATYRTPARDTAGAYLTPNRDLPAEQATWHVRVALNVAALGCRDADERATVAAYNAVLATAKDQLALAAAGTERRYQVKFGAGWRSAHDDGMTRLYNFFPQTTAHDEFCAAAKSVLAEAQTTAPADFTKLAQAALPRLEAPFLAFYARYDSYREELVSWQGRHMPRVVVASAAPPVAIAVDLPPVMLAAVGPAAPAAPVVAAPAQAVAIAAVVAPSAAPAGSPPVLLASVTTLKR